MFNELVVGGLELNKFRPTTVSPYIEVDDIGGNIAHAAAFLEHNALRNSGFGFGYDWFDIDVDLADTFWPGRADVRLQGAMIFIQMSY